MIGKLSANLLKRKPSPELTPVNPPPLSAKIGRTQGGVYWISVPDPKKSPILERFALRNRYLGDKKNRIFSRLRRAKILLFWSDLPFRNHDFEGKNTFFFAPAARKIFSS